MGLDISIETNNHEEVYSQEYYKKENDYFNKHNLSRTFCNFMCRKNIVDTPELDQIGKITGIDISPIYQMEEMLDEVTLETSLLLAETKEEEEQIRKTAEESQNELEGNIDKVLMTINILIEKLSSIKNLPNQLLSTNIDSLNNNVYFSDFTEDKGEGYIGNNFGQDLRNFKRFLEYAKSKGTTTVWFDYG